MGRVCCVQAAVVDKPEEPHGVGGFERVSYSNPLGRRSVTPQAQVRATALVSSAVQVSGHSRAFACAVRVAVQAGDKVPMLVDKGPSREQVLEQCLEMPSVSVVLNGDIHWPLCAP